MHTRLALALVALISAHAAADTPKYKRAQHVPPPPRATERAASATAPKPAQPALTSDQVLTRIERTQPIRAQQEGILLKLVAETPDADPDKPELLFRLAEEYAMQLQFWRLEANAPHPK